MTPTDDDYVTTVNNVADIFVACSALRDGLSARGEHAHAFACATLAVDCYKFLEAIEEAVDGDQVAG